MKVVLGRSYSVTEREQTSNTFKRQVQQTVFRLGAVVEVVEEVIDTGASIC